MNKKNHIISMVAVIVIVAGGAFYGGMQYGNKKVTGLQSTQGGRNGGAGFGGQRGVQGGQRPGGANGGAGNFAAGQISAKDDTSITVKTKDGSSKIVFFSPSTGIDKSVAGASSDLNIGQQVTITGKSSSDGTLTAQNIQIRPDQPAAESAR